jgi:two-component system phosphate regulon response regulator PhoB
MAQRILIVDDEADLAELLAYNLSAHGYETRVANDGRTALAETAEFRPDVLVLDVMMPELSGLDVAKRLRSDPRTKSIPILMLTARADEADELRGLAAGADDFVAKPFSMKVLEARIEAVLRRAASSEMTAGTSSIVSFGPITIDTDAHEAFVGSQTLRLTVTEFRLLLALVQAEGRVLTRQTLINRAMGQGVTVTERTIDVHVTSIRKKLKECSGVLRTVRGVGYRMVDPTPERADAGSDTAEPTRVKAD